MHSKKQKQNKNKTDINPRPSMTQIFRSPDPSTFIFVAVMITSTLCRDAANISNNTQKQSTNKTKEGTRPGRPKQAGSV